MKYEQTDLDFWILIIFTILGGLFVLGVYVGGHG